MQSTGRVIRPASTVVNPGLRLIVQNLNDKIVIPTIMKDIHLIEAANSPEADKTVISMDKKARNAFSSNHKEIVEFKGIVWINPAIVEEKAIEWLKNGAKPEQERTLEAYNISKIHRNKSRRKVNDSESSS